MTTLVHVPGVGLAVAGPTRCYLPPELDGRDWSDPEVQLAALMCLYARLQDEAGAGYSDEAAEVIVRAVLASALDSN